MSLIAFDPEFVRFVDTYLQHRERISKNRALNPIDIGVFSLFYRFVADVPPGLRFTPGAKSSTLAGLQILSPSRLILLCSIFHQPHSVSDGPVGDSKPSTPLKDLVDRWISLNPLFEREIGRLLESWSLAKSSWNPRNAAGLRALQELLPLAMRRRILPSLAGVRGSIRDALALIGKWHSNSRDPAERGHLLVSLAYGLVQLDEATGEEFLKTVLGEEEDLPDGDKEMLKDMSSSIPWFREHFLLTYVHALHLDETRVNYSMNVMENLPPSDLGGDPNLDILAIHYVETSGMPPTEQEDEDSPPSGPVDQLKEIAPHLGRYFCERLLEACNWDLNRAISSVMEGTLPEQVLHIDFSAEEEEAKPQPPVPIAPKRDDRSADDILKDRMDRDVKARIATMYDEYDDEYDDALDDGGGRLAVDTGAKNLDEDDPEEEYAEDEDSAPVQRGVDVPAFVRRDSSSTSTTAFSKPQPSTIRPVPKRPQDFAPPAIRGGRRGGGSDLARPAPGPRDIIPPVSREASVVDVDGVRRNAQGKVVEEDVLMRPNMNRAVAPPESTERKRGGGQKLQQQPRVLTPEEEDQRIKRDRERKETRGNQVRTRGADRKQAKSGF